LGRLPARGLFGCGLGAVSLQLAHLPDIEGQAGNDHDTDLNQLEQRHVH
jgi:hypothetical protein